MTVERAFCAALLTLLLTGCGGGGGGGSSPPPQPPPPPPPPPANEAPRASFTVLNGDGLAPLTVTFDAGTSTDTDGSIVRYDWDFGDGGPTASGETVTRTFEDTGFFTVTLEIADDDGATDSTSRSVRARGATVSGVIRIGAGSAVDSDVNDRFTTPTGNDDFASAQNLGAPPIRLGGFVNLPGTGSDEGNFAGPGDPDDYYFVDLAGGETIVLSIAEPGADLDLELYTDDPTPVLVDASVSPDPASDLTEDLQAPAEAGGYFVRVFAVDGPSNEAGASNYVLSIGAGGALALGQRRAKRLTDPIVAGELLLATTAGAPVDRYRLQRPAGARDFRLTSARLDQPAAPAVTLPALDLPPGARVSPAAAARYATLLAARAARRAPEVAHAEVNVLRRPLRVPNDEFYDLQWHYQAIGLEQAWDLTTGLEPGNPEVVVAVVDTGVLLNHPDLDDQLLRAGGQVVGFDFIEDPARANDGDGIDPNPDDPGDEGRGPDDGSFHGTHVAGTVAAESDNLFGVAGVSWQAKLMPLRALGIDGGTTFDVLQAVRYAAGLANVSGTVPPVRADIVNLSLGSDFYSEAEQAALNEVRAAGVFLVASAGNDASTVPSYPASYDGVVSVSASTITGDLAPYSNFGPLVDVAAPGGDGSTDLDVNGQPDAVVSTIGQGEAPDVTFGYALLQGTSMAAPHVSGVIALMKAVNPGLTPAQFDALLQSGDLTVDAGAAGRDDQFGWGIIDATRAVQAAIDAAGGSLGAVLSVSTGTLNFQAFTQSLLFSVGNLGDEPVSVSVSDDAPWLGVTPVDVDADGLGQYQVTVDRSGLADGNYAGTVTITPDDAAVSARSVSVAMRVTSADVNADAGQHYVILVPPDAEESAVAIGVNAVDGQYTFQLTDVAPGDYRLFAGTDHDDDNFICDGGEACGAFPSLSSPAVLRIDAREQPSVTDQSFSSEFRTTVTTTSAGADASDTGVPGLKLNRPERPQP